MSPRRRLPARLAAAGFAGILAGGLFPLGPAPAAPGPGSPPQSFSYVRSTDGGRSFTPLQLADAVPEAGFTQVDAFGGTVHALYDSNDPQPRQMLYRRSTDGGGSFDASVRLDRPQFGAKVEVGDSSEGDVAASGSGVHAVWEDDRFLDTDFTVPAPGLRVRNDLILSDGTVISAEQPGGDPEDDGDNTVLPEGFVFPAGSVDPRTDRNIFIEDSAEPQDDRDEIFYTRSDDGGGGFPVAVNISDSPEFHDTDPAVAADGEVRLARSGDGGDTWDEVNVNLTNAGGAQDDPAVAAEGERITVAFRNRQDDPRIAFVHSENGGGRFSVMTDLPRPAPATDFSSDTPPAVLAGAGMVHVLACHEDTDSPTDGFDLLYWRSTDGGATFADPVVIDRGDEECNKPALDGGGGVLHAVYERDVFGKGEVFLIQSTDDGRTWGSPRNLSSDSDSSSTPSVSVDAKDAGDVHVSWSDQSEFLFALRYGQELPVEEGGTHHFANEDVVRFDGSAYEMVLDGSDVGLRNFRIDALAQLSPKEFVLSFTEPGPIPGVGWVDDSDLVLFTATRLGEQTAGRFRLYFDGSDIGLTSPSEDIDAVEIQGGNLFISTTGSFSAASRGRALNGADEDILVCESATTNGKHSSCRALSLAFEGSAVGLGDDGGEDIDAFSFDAVDPAPFVNDDGETEVDERQAFFSFKAHWSVATARGGESDLAHCRLPDANLTEGEPLFTLKDCGGPDVALHMVFEADAHLIDENIMALELEY